MYYVYTWGLPAEHVGTDEGAVPGGTMRHGEEAAGEIQGAAG